VDIPAMQRPGTPGGATPLETLLEALDAGFWQVHGRGESTVFSPRLLELLGIHGERDTPLATRVWRSLFVDDADAGIEVARSAGAAGESFTHDLRIRRESDGAPRTLRVRGRWYTDGPLRDSVLGVAFDVTESREHWGELRDTRAQLEAAERIGETGSWSWHVRSGDVRWSSETYRILGIAPSATPSFELVLTMAVDPSHRRQFEQMVQSALEHDTPYDFEMPVRAADGSVRILHTRGAVARDADGTPLRMFGTIKDITAVRSAERELQEREARFRLLAESSPDGVFLTDRSGAATYANDRLLGWFGLSFEEFAAGGWLGRVHPDDLAMVERLGTTEEARHQPFNYEYRILVGGHERWVRVRTQPHFDPEGRLLGHVGSVEDTTLEHRAAAERAQLEEKLQQARKLESVGLLAGGIAHDFNNLLVGVLANASFARESVPADGPLGEALLDIERAAQRAADLTRQLLSYAGRASTRRSVIDLAAVVGELQGLLGARIPPHVAFRAELDTAQARVLGDATELRQILMNLVTNGVDAIDGGGTVRLRVSVESFDVNDLATFVLGAGRAAGEYVCVSVDDDGRGMTPQVLSRMFDPFYSTKGSGRGLGLAATLGLLNSHGGCIQVESAVGRGTQVRMLLPATDEETTPVPTLTSRPQAQAGSGHLLLADDDPAARQAARRVLEHAGYRVTEAVDGREAVQRFAERPGDWSVLLLDLTMPVMTGDAALREIRATHPNVPILLMSGYTAEDVATIVPQDGITGFLHKPYRVAELLVAVAGLRPESRSAGT
jgi:PAS domain S-box-containing protein